MIGPARTIIDANVGPWEVVYAMGAEVPAGTRLPLQLRGRPDVLSAGAPWAGLHARMGLSLSRRGQAAAIFILKDRATDDQGGVERSLHILR